MKQPSQFRRTAACSFVAVLVGSGCSPVIEGGAPGGGGDNTTSVTTGAGPSTVGAGGTSGSAGGAGGASSSAVTSGVTSSTGAGGAPPSCSPPNAPTRLTPLDHLGMRQFALDDAYAYWANDAQGTISRVSLCTQEVTVLVTGEISPMAVAVDAEHVFWGTAADKGKLRMAPIGGGPATTLWHGGAIWSLALDGPRIYFAAWDHGGIYGIDKDGTHLARLVDGEVGQRIAIDETNVYFTTWGSVMQVAKVGGAATTLASVNLQNGLSAGGGQVFAGTYETDPMTEHLISVPRDGGTLTDFAPGADVYEIATTPTSVVWSGESGVFAAPLGGGAPTQIAAAGVMDAVVVHGGAVAWNAYGDGLYWSALP